MIINQPHALYYNGELIGIITNPDPHGNIMTICEGLSPDEGLADIRPIDPEALRVALATLGIDAVLEPPKPPEGSVWVKVDPTDFEQADDGETTHYGGEIRITNDTHVDIVIKCSGDDRGDDHCYWPTTEGILDALFHTVVPGVVESDYGKWEDFHDDVCQHIYSGEPFYCYVHREKMAVVLMDPEGDELTHKIPLTH